MSTSDGVDLQGTAIGIGTVIALLFMIYGTIISESVFGVDTTTVAAWVFAITFASVAGVHYWASHYNLSFGFLGAAIGWLFVLLGTTGVQILIGLLVLVLSGLYIVTVTLRLRNTQEESTT